MEIHFCGSITLVSLILFTSQIGLYHIFLNPSQKREQVNTVFYNEPHHQTPNKLTRAALINELAKRIRDSQVLKNHPYRFPLTWQEDKGMYPSHIKLNVVGPPHMAAVRDTASVFDNNMFSTGWVTICVLETRLYARGPIPTDSQLKSALEAIDQYHDKNRRFNNSVMNFWPQTFNRSTGMWESTPTNMLRAFQIFDVVPLKEMEEILKLLGMSDLEHLVESILSMRSTFERAFHIPPDFDDTFINVALGTLLKDLHQELPEAFSLWTSQNPNVSSSVLSALKTYAYRPFSRDQNLNTIDPRTFFYMRQFLAQAESKGEDIALVPTWAQNLDEVRTNYFKGVAMPFQVNNVDVTVAANTLYGLTASVLSGLFPANVLEDPAIKQVYVNTSSMIAWQLRHQLYHRPDLELTYYPSRLEFYWFTARTLARLEAAFSTPQRRQPVPAVMREVYQVLKPALENSMTQDVLRRAQPMADSTMVYFDDFLGDGDVDIYNRTVVRGEDRLFTTSMAVNALLSTWTVFDEFNRTLHWKHNTPSGVRTTVEKSVKFLETYILKDTYKPWNAFFSGSVKDSGSAPYWYPVNRVEYLNGTVIHDDSRFPTGGPFFLGVQGSIPESTYQSLLRQKHMGSNTPLNFTTYNQPGGYFPFWSSSAYTYATAMLAVGRFDNIVE